MHQHPTDHEASAPTAEPMPTRHTDQRSSHLDRSADRREAGEGVISTAIAVLVMSFLGAAMWVTFQSVWKDTSAATERQVQIIGSESGR